MFDVDPAGMVNFKYECSHRLSYVTGIKLYTFFHACILYVAANILILPAITSIIGKYLYKAHVKRYWRRLPKDTTEKTWQHSIRGQLLLE
jgi:hypothetical protein